MELSSKGTVKGSLSFKYFCSGSNICYVLFVFLLYIAAQVAASLVDFWVSFWYVLTEKRFNRYFQKIGFNRICNLISEMYKTLTSP